MLLLWQLATATIATTDAIASTMAAADCAIAAAIATNIAATSTTFCFCH